MLLDQTITIVTELLKVCEVDDLTINYDADPIHESSKRQKDPTHEYTITVTEKPLYAGTLQAIIKVLETYPHVNFRITDKGMEIYEMEA